MKENFCGTKYTVVYDEKTGDLYALRYGERWRDLAGDGMVMAMLQAVEAERELLRAAGLQLAFALDMGRLPSTQRQQAQDLLNDIEHHFGEHAAQE